MIVDVDVVGQITESVNESLLLWTSIYCIFWARVRESCGFLLYSQNQQLFIELCRTYGRVVVKFGIHGRFNWYRYLGLAFRL